MSWYSKNKTKHIERVKSASVVRREKIKQFIFHYLQSHPCVDCGESDPIVLEFDHRVKSEKSFSIAKSVDKGIDDIKNEINKCDVRCANCHRRKTAKESGHYRYNMSL